MVVMRTSTSLSSNPTAQPGQRGLVLHAAWVGARGGRSRHLALWAEAQQRPLRRRPPRSASGVAESAPARRPHPYCANLVELLDALDRLWRTARPGGRPRTSCTPTRLDIQLPSAANRPVASPEAQARGWAREAPEDAPSQITLWRVHALLLDPAHASALLPGLPHSAGAQAAAPKRQRTASAWDDNPPEMLIGADLRFWATAAKLTLSAIVRQRYLPGVQEVNQGGRYDYSYSYGPSVAGHWSIALLETDERERFERLAMAMPDVARTAFSPLDPIDTGVVANRDTLLEDFCNTTLNTLIGDWTRRLNVDLTIHRTQEEPERSLFHFGSAYYDVYGSLSARWLRSLATPGFGIYLNSRDARTLLDGIERWHARAEVERNVPFRLCLRLSAPGEGDDEGSADNTDILEATDSAGGSVADDTSQSEQAVTLPLLAPLDDTAEAPHAPRSIGFDADSTGWRLEYLLQARDDPSLLLPIAEVWRERGEIAQFLQRRFERPYERALGWLGQAARIFPPVLLSLRQGRPEGCDLSGAEAYQLLREALPALEEAGISVLAPSWWKRAPVRPKLRLEVRRPPQTSSGLLGLDAVVHFDWKVALGDEELTQDDLDQLVALKQPLVRVRGKWVEIRREDIDAVARTLEARGKRQMSLGEALSVSMTGQINDNAVEIEELRADAWINDLLARLRGADALTEEAPPAALRAELRPYQLRGLDWLTFLTRYGLGACLADDMGLGKTLQLLALILRLKERVAMPGPVLLVCPTSVVGNWVHEARRFAPELRLLTHHGAGRIGRAGAAKFAAEVAGHDVVVTTYSLLPRDAEALANVTWGMIALDEAQFIKNAETKQARAARALNAPMRVALTGTPVENRLAELWSIMHFLNPGYLGSQRHFHEQFAAPIEQRHDKRSSAQLQALVRPFVLRRLKSDKSVIRDLPEKIEMREYCTLTREQATLYEAVVREGLRQLEQTLDPMARRGAVLAMLSKLKQVCNHPAHFLNDGSALAGRSGKLARLEDLVEELLDEGDRALIFTQFTVMGERLREYLDERFKTKTLYLHGATPRTQRERMVERFQSADGPPLFLLSLKAGGAGLNLTNANHVIHYDRWWNPAVETQATDRAFRIGQTRNVQVRKFVCTGTLEERIDEMIEQKRALAEGIFGAGEGWLTELSTAELRELFRLRDDAVAG